MKDTIHINELYQVVIEAKALIESIKGTRHEDLVWFEDLEAAIKKIDPEWNYVDIPIRWED